MCPDELPVVYDRCSVAGDTEIITIVWKTKDTSNDTVVITPVNLTGGIGNFILTSKDGTVTDIESEPFIDPTDGTLTFILLPAVSTSLLNDAVKSRELKYVINFTGNYQTAEEVYTQLMKGSYTIHSRTL